MLDAFLFSFNCVAPLFLMVGVGSLFRSLGWIKAEHMPMLNKLCFYLLLPCMLFQNALEADYSLIQTPALYVYTALSFVVAAWLLSLIVPRFVKNPMEAGAFVHSSFRPNAVVLGIPLAINMLGESGAFPAVMMAMLLGPLFNILGVIVLSFFSSNGSKVSLRQVGRDVAKNPLVVSVVLGLVGSFVGLRLPGVLREPISSFSGAATPLAMLVIGARFEWKRMVRDLRLICASSLVKLVVLPLLFVPPAILLGARGGELAALYIVHAVPSASTGGIVTEIMGCDGTLSNEIVLVSTGLSIFTLFLGLMLLKHFALL